jgi:Pectate lyase superfamily protein/Right handed beta helix region
VTLATTSNTTVAQGNGLTTSFTFTFPVPNASELFVYLTNAGSSPVLLSNSQYSTTGIGAENGGSVNYPLVGSPIPTGSTLTIQRTVTYQQLTSLVDQSGYYPNVVENALDYLTMQTQQLAEQELLTLQVPLEASLSNLVLPTKTARATTLVGFDALGNAITYPVTASVGAGNLISEGPFVSGVGFTPGVTTSLVLSKSYVSVANVSVHFDGTYQGTDQYTLTGNTINFLSPIPVGVSKVYIVGGTTLSVGIPATGSVTDSSVAVGSKLYNRITDWVDVRDYGAVGNGTTDDTVAIQTAINAAQAGPGLLYVPGGNYLISATLNITNSLEFRGAGRESVNFNQNTNFTMFNIAGFSGGFKFGHITINNNSSTVTSGDAIFINAAFNGSVDDVLMNNVWNGVHVTTSQALYVNRVSTFGHKNAGILCDGNLNNDITFRDCLIDGELSGVPNAAFGIYLQDKNEGVNFDGCEIILCMVSLQTGSVSYAPGVRPAYCRFTNCYFDSCPQGAQLNNCVEMTFTACWFTAYASGASSCTVAPANSDSLLFQGCSFINAAQHGCVVDSGAKRTTFKGCKFISNGTSLANYYSGLLIQAGATDFIVDGCTATNGLGFPGIQKYGILVIPGSSDRYVITNNLVSGNGTSGVYDGGSGANKNVSNNF